MGDCGIPYQQDPPPIIFPIMQILSYNAVLQNGTKAYLLDTLIIMSALFLLSCFYLKKSCEFYTLKNLPLYSQLFCSLFCLLKTLSKFAVVRILHESEFSKKSWFSFSKMIKSMTCFKNQAIEVNGLEQSRQVRNVIFYLKWQTKGTGGASTQISSLGDSSLCTKNYF